MNTYQELVADFIAASRRMFVSPEYFVDLGTGMWIDVVAIEPSAKRVYLCEVTFSKNLDKLKKQVPKFNAMHDDIKNCIFLKAGIPNDWSLCIWIFILKGSAQRALALSQAIPLKITFLEYTAPWFYSNGFWGTSDEPGKPYAEIPKELQ